MIHTQECTTKAETVCSSCNTEVFAIEITNNKCDKCGSSLETHIENVAVTVNPLPIFATMF